MIMMTIRMNIVTRRDKQRANTGTEDGVTEWDQGLTFKVHMLYINIHS